jgi:hypothetical protein
MAKKRNLEEIKEKLYNKYPDQMFDFSEYKNTTTPIRVIDPEYGEWFPTVRNLLRKKRKCRKREIAERTHQVIPVDEVEHRISNIHGNIVFLDKTTYINSSTKCRFFDRDFGEFWMIPTHVFNGSGHSNRGKLKRVKGRILPITEVKKRLYEVHGDSVIIDEDTYVSMYKKATFIHEDFGEWEATPDNVITKGSSHPAYAKEKTKLTFLKNYGVSNPSQNKDIFDRITKSRWRKLYLNHWKTGKQLTCISSYEYAVVKVLNERKINFDWQIKFILEDDVIYFVDLYLVDIDKYVEIKGYFFSEKNKWKWETFHSIYKNSEIWFKDEVCLFTGKKEYWIKKEFRYEWEKNNKRHI